MKHGIKFLITILNLFYKKFKVQMRLKNRMIDGNHWQALQYVYKRHLIQGQALMYTDLRERTYVMMNDEKIVIRRRGRCKFFFFKLNITFNNF